MKKLIKTFTAKLSEGGVGLYYFAGHGINVEGKNYLVATNSDLQSKDDVEYETYALNRITKNMQKAKNRLNIIILDACRNDPFSRGTSGGLAPIGDAKGIFVAYATQAGNVALDGETSNGVFTKNLIKNIQIPGDTIETVFKNTRDDVQQATHGKQSPGVYNQITGDFYFTFSDNNSSYLAPKPLLKSAHFETKDMGDLAFWEYVKAENSVAYYKAYNKKYPNGTFVDVANEKIALIKEEKDAKANKIVQAKIDERDKPHLGLGGGLIGLEIWIRNKQFSYGSSLKSTPDRKVLEITAFLNYHISPEKNGMYTSVSAGYHQIELNSEVFMVPGGGLGVGYRATFFDLIYIDYGVKALFNSKQSTATFNTFTGFEF